MMKTTHVTGAWWARGISASVLIVLTSATLLYGIYLIVGNTPAEGGAGWDGRVYLYYAQMAGFGEPVAGDPYRTIRLSGFLPIIGAASRGFSVEQLIAFQMFFNIGLISLAMALLHDTLRQLGVSPKVALLTLLTAVASWSALVMPVFYPILSDHMALALSCLCLWCWVRSFQTMLYILVAYCLWVMPGLFIVPLILAGMPRSQADQPDGVNRPYLVYILFGLALLAVFPALYKMIENIPDYLVEGHGSTQGGQTSALSLRLVSSGTLLGSVALVLWFGAKALSDSAVWRSINPGATIMAMVFFAFSALAMYFLVDWSANFNGPPLMLFMLLQSLSAPFKPAAAHFLYFGPVIAMAIIACVGWAIGRKPSPPRALLVCMLGFLPVLALGSESRQWIGVLPIAAVLVGLADFSRLQRVLSLVVAMALIIPAVGLHSGVETALAESLSFQSGAWQYYFSRQGPWMSLQSYQIGAALLIVYVLLMFGARHYDKSRSNQAALV
ncbi:hypothetical protein V0R50_10000 [Pseudomonas sp. 148P]|uniref:DUF2029 domain-containing protein n=1 Tax=Pseudomonas ulcerans TaxID=3115852 RepID=A0ABU7HPX6_9PSED|nr:MULTISPECIES: hypothetical protein [unclassified Pseudomonas]MEE1921969.1 hypothetical protein [Pseudomonas sp. 147P]MEE1933553.1 hypothetical protein [Pseudomonas sp. 148P]